MDLNICTLVVLKYHIFSSYPPYPKSIFPWVRHALDACNGSGESCCGINNSVISSYFQDWDGMMLESERVGDPFTACVSPEDSNATIVIRGMQ
jgi:hypothetical protein